MKIAVFETEEWEHAACLSLQPEHAISCTRDALNKATVQAYADAEIVSPFVNSKLGADVLAQLPRLKFIATRSTGYDHIDLAYCAAHGIAVSNVPDYGDATVAEHTFALLLAVARNLVDAVEHTRRGNFSQSGLRGIELHGKVLGVIGTGRIGRRVIAIANGFGMKVLAFDTNPDFTHALEMGVEHMDLGNVLARSDIVTLHVPSTPATAGLISDAQFAVMKRGAIMINTARGNVIDTAALVRALADGKIRGAGLDVLPQEPLIREEAEIFRGPASTEYDLKALVANHVLLRFPNVIVTPHIAYNTEDAVRRIIETTLGNIRAFGRGQPQNTVSR
ncbi:MAG: hydroxyacid dehydrogenase [Rhodospirillaceae bacterium]|nr:hydroxyacid dehydrogenase [Rhodospirillaceae bacterium]